MNIAKPVVQDSPRYLPFAAALVTAVAISVAAYSGHIPQVLSGHGFDKVMHAGMAATLTALLARALRGRVLVAALLVLLPLAIDEYFQRFSAQRSSDWGDMIADGIGAGLAVVVVSVLAALRPQSPKPSPMPNEKKSLPSSAIGSP